MAKVLVTGATGFVGKRLVFQLLAQGHEVFALCRIVGTKVVDAEQPHLHYIWGDLRNPETMGRFPKDLEAAYYLVHSMSEIMSDLAQTEMDAANQFIEGLQNTTVKQIIYLGGIINHAEELSPHLKSRLLTEEALKKSSIPVTILRASIIVGAGSASFEIIRDLCEKLPFMIAPKWLNSPCQPIAIEDVLFYLSGVLLQQESYHKIFDIGGPEVFTFKQLLLQYSNYRNLKRIVMDIPFLTPRLSSLWMVLITSVRFSLCYYLVESIKTSSIVKLTGIQSLLPHQCLTFKQALEIAFQSIHQENVLSTWMDSWELEGINPNVSQYIEVPKEGCLFDEKRLPIKDSKEAAIKRIWRIGGYQGYYSLNWAWKLRGLIDKLFGGVGLNRGRRHPSELYAGDSVDFWRVLCADKKEGVLILLAGMKVPGEAWLQFIVKTENNLPVLVQRATFRPKGLIGRLYWYSMFPFHTIIFRKMAKMLAGEKQYNAPGSNE